MLPEAEVMAQGGSGTEEGGESLGAMTVVVVEVGMMAHWGSGTEEDGERALRVRHLCSG